jgi:hypothetical protein
VGASGDACQVAICVWAIKLDRSTQLPTSLTQQSNSNGVGNGNGNKVADNKEGNGKGAMAFVMVMMVVGKQQQQHGQWGQQQEWR